jgi:hypothetical protein
MWAAHQPFADRSLLFIAAELHEQHDVAAFYVALQRPDLIERDPPTQSIRESG